MSAGECWVRAWQKEFARLWLCLGLALLAGMGFSTGVQAREVALVTALSGEVFRVAGQKREELQLYSRLRQGDFIGLGQGATLRVLYAQSGRQELWQGTGRIEISARGGQALGLAGPQVSTLGDWVARQIMKMPEETAAGEIMVIRSRSIPTHDAVQRLEGDYRKLKMEAAPGDLNPELFLLAGLLEMREMQRLSDALDALSAAHPGNFEAKVLVSLYRKAMRNAN